MSQQPPESTWTESTFDVLMTHAELPAQTFEIEGEAFGVWGVGDPWSAEEEFDGHGPTLTHIPSGCSVLDPECEASRDELKALAERLKSADVPTEKVGAIRDHADDYETIVEDWTEEIRE